MQPFLPLVFSLLVSATVAVAFIGFMLSGALDGLLRLIWSQAQRRREQSF
jgi:hypothetical protein